MYLMLFSQASMEVIVSIEVSDHCFGALFEVILGNKILVNQYKRSERRLNEDFGVLRGFFYEPLPPRQWIRPDFQTSNWFNRR